MCADHTLDELSFFLHERIVLFHPVLHGCALLWIKEATKLFNKGKSLLNFSLAATGYVRYQLKTNSLTMVLLSYFLNGLSIRAEIFRHFLKFWGESLASTLDRYVVSRFHGNSNLRYLCISFAGKNKKRITSFNIVCNFKWTKTFQIKLYNCQVIIF